MEKIKWKGVYVMGNFVKNYLEAQGIKRSDKDYQEITARYEMFRKEKGDFNGLKEANIILHYAPKGSEIE